MPNCARPGPRSRCRGRGALARYWQVHLVGLRWSSARVFVRRKGSSKLAKPSSWATKPNICVWCSGREQKANLDVSRWGVGAPYSPSRVPLSGARFRGDRAGAAPGTGGGATWDPSSGARGDQGPPTRPTRVGGVGVEEVPLLRGPGGPGPPYSPFTPPHPYSGRRSWPI